MINIGRFRHRTRRSSYNRIGRFDGPRLLATYPISICLLRALAVSIRFLFARLSHFQGVVLPRVDNPSPIEAVDDAVVGAASRIVFDQQLALFQVDTEEVATARQIEFDFATDLRDNGPFRI